MDNDGRADLMIEILKTLQSDTLGIKREITSQGLRLSSIEDHLCRMMTSIYATQSDITNLKDRVDRIDRRLGLTDTEH